MATNADIIWQGIKLGLVLAVMTGPIFFALVQAGVESGFRAGAAIGLGVWVSDLMFIIGVYSGLEALQRWVSWQTYAAHLGIAGGIVLSLFGLYTVFTRPRAPRPTGGHLPSTYAALWVKGFLINTVNPFTVFFWITVMTAYVLAENWGRRQAGFFFGSILGVIILTDLAKVLLAKKIRPWLKENHIVLLRRISGAVLILFGLVLFWRSVFWV